MIHKQSLLQKFDQENTQQQFRQNPRQYQRNSLQLNSESCSLSDQPRLIQNQKPAKLISFTQRNLLNFPPQSILQNTYGQSDIEFSQRNEKQILAFFQNMKKNQEIKLKKYNFLSNIQSKNLDSLSYE
ncbi:hypothetical protein ABPG72_019387 [Tetrahymena utriculariae]